MCPVTELLLFQFVQLFICCLDEVAIPKLFFFLVCFPKLFTGRIGSRKSLLASLLSLKRAYTHTHTHSLIHLVIFGCIMLGLHHSVWPAELLGSLVVVCRLNGAAYGLSCSMARGI